MLKYWMLTVALLGALAPGAGADFTLTLFHHSDAESALLSAPGQSAYGGVARFKAKLDALRNGTSNPYLTLSNGDMFLAGPQFDATLSNPGGPFYDALAQDMIGYDAFAPANHEFDFGPQVARRYFDEFSDGSLFLSANADFTAEPALSPLVGARLRSSTLVDMGGEKVGIIGILPSELATISSPGNVAVTPREQLVARIQSEVDAIRFNADPARRANKIILMGQQQTIANDIAVIPQLRGVDVIISGGGEELVANPGTDLVPGDTRSGVIGGLANQYPLKVTDADGKSALLVGGAGKYKYIGQLDIQFDANGEIVSATGNTNRVADFSVDPLKGVTADAVIQAQVVGPVQAHVQGLQTAKIARSTVPLEGRRSGPDNTGIRKTETNLGDLCADALIWQAAKSSLEAGRPLSGPIVGLQNGGGIRNDSLIPASADGTENLSRYDAFSVNAFANFVSVIEDMPAIKLKELVEYSVSRVGGGGFGQWGGLRFAYDPSRPASDRVVSLSLTGAGVGGADLQIVSNGILDPHAPLIDFATINFTANGGDGYPFNMPFVNFAVSYTQALENYLTAPSSLVFGGLAGLDRLVSADRYPMLGLDDPKAFELARRIDVVPEPATLAAVLAGMAVLAGRRRK